MKTIIFSTLACMFCTASVLASDEKEPELGYVLLVNGKPTRLQANTDTVIAGTYTNLQVRLVPEKERRFTHGGLSFKYPAHFAFEADFRTPGLKLWTLTGNNMVIMVQKYEDSGIGPAELVSQLKEKFGEATKTSKIVHRFNGKDYSGIHVSVELASVKLFQDILEIPTEKGSRLLMLQDLHSEEKVSEDETKKVRQLLNETIQLDAQPDASSKGREAAI